MLKKSLLFIMLFQKNNLSLNAMEPDLYLKKLEAKKYLKMANGDEIIISQPGTKDEDLVKKRVFMRKRNKVIWDKTFNSEYGDHIWQSAHFIPIIPEKFAYDYDKDGNEEIAIAVWHGGQNVEGSSVYIFSISGNSLTLKAQKSINYEFSRYVYETK
ncbi:MAG: hypothetical protein ACOYL6_00510 [Bacteriovoracaceae bacterium]